MTDVGIYEGRRQYEDNGNPRHLKRWASLMTLIVETPMHIAKLMQDNRGEQSLHGEVQLLKGGLSTEHIIDEVESHEK